LIGVEQVRYFGENMRVSLAQSHDALENEKDLNGSKKEYMFV
jgi:hypothetical protein